MTIYCDGSDSRGLNAIAVIMPGAKVFMEFETPFNVNQIEYKAVYAALRLAENDSIIYSDNKNVVRQLNGQSKIRDKWLSGYHTICSLMMLEKNIKIEWISRDNNLAGKYLESKLKKKGK